MHRHHPLRLPEKRPAHARVNGRPFPVSFPRVQKMPLCGVRFFSNTHPAVFPRLFILRAYDKASFRTPLKFFMNFTDTANPGDNRPRGLSVRCGPIPAAEGFRSAIKLNIGRGFLYPRILYEPYRIDAVQNDFYAVGLFYDFAITVCVDAILNPTVSLP